MNELPTDLLLALNETLEELDLSGNSFTELSAFPSLGNLETLILDDCDIDSVVDEAFDQVTNLKSLSLQRNRFSEIPPQVLVPSLVCLKLRGFTEVGGKLADLKIQVCSIFKNFASPRSVNKNVSLF